MATIKKSTCSDLCSVKGCLESIMEEVSKAIQDQEFLFDVRLILNELVINGAIHGNKENKNKRINIDLQLEHNFIRIEIIDEGEGFIYDKNAYNPMDLKCNGRGLVIADGLSDEFFIEKNKVVSLKYF